MFCILLMLLSSVDVALAKGKKKKARKVQRTEMYEEIDNFDFLYSNDYDVNMSFASTDDILSQATSFIGTRYHLGSKGPYAFDCSGFTSFVFSKLGIQLKRSSQEQHTQGQAVASIAELLPGDLVFFGRHGRRGTTINHVGIVTAVDAATGAFEFIHSSSSQGVRVDRYPDVAYWKKHFTGGRRIIGIEAAQK